MSASTPLPFNVCRLERPAVPLWLDEWAATESCSVMRHEIADCRISVRASRSLSVIEAELPGIASMSPQQFEQQVANLYGHLSQLLQSCEASHPWRFWNYVPRIVDELPDGRNWYMAFNAGRYRAYRKWLGDAFEPRLTAASAVGHRGSSLHVHVVAGRQPGRGIENPRQQSAYRYTTRYGPLPPCFARATFVERPDAAAAHVIVAGTASIVGEDTVHIGDPSMQMDETIRNLQAVAHRRALAAAVSSDDAAGSSSAVYSEIRAYIVREADEPLILRRIADAFGNVGRVEVMHADLCRPDLLVEIDGLAEVACSRDKRVAGDVTEARA